MIKMTSVRCSKMSDDVKNYIFEKSYCRALKSVKYLFEDYYEYEYIRVNKKGETVMYTVKSRINRKQKRQLTEEEQKYISEHSAREIAEHFNRSTTWAYARKNGKGTM